MREKNKKYLSTYLLQEAKIKRFKDTYLKFPERKNECYLKIKECEQIRYEIEDKINLLENDIEREILYRKYILGNTLEEISYKLNYSKRQIERLHIKALENFNFEK